MFAGNERTVGFCECTDGSGEAIFKTVKKSLRDIGLNTTNVLGCSFDGASNMKSKEKGVFHYLQSENCKCFFCWCFAHRFNLCVDISCKKRSGI